MTNTSTPEDVVALINQLGLSDLFDEFSMYVVWADPARKHHPEGHVAFNFGGETLTFEMLEQVSHLFGTRCIDVGCEHGTGSDPCHESVITIYGAQGL
jgi:hypothetical protein